MAPSRRRAPLRGAAAQIVAIRLAAAGPIRSANGSQRSYRSSSSAPSKPNTTIPPSVSPRATSIAIVATPILPAPDAPVLAFSSLSAPAIAVPAPASIEELFKLFMQTYMDTVKNQAQAPVQAPTPPVSVESKEQPLKARFPDLYFGKLYLDCYWFCQQFEDHFDTARANGKNRTPFAASFLWDGISTCWTQYKRRHAQEKGPDVVIPWKEFKAFLRENCGNSKTFVKGIWNRFRGGS